MLKRILCRKLYQYSLAIARGAKRIELCDNLAVGGTNQVPGVQKEVFCNMLAKKIPVMTIIIRPRGDFVYNIELKIMHTGSKQKLGTETALF